LTHLVGSASVRFAILRNMFLDRFVVGIAGGAME
jgi:hypothetical protein